MDTMIRQIGEAIAYTALFLLAIGGLAVILEVLSIL